MKDLHILLLRYRVLPLLITLFLMYYTADMTSWYKENFSTLKEWQNVPIVTYLTTLVAGLVGIAKMAIQPNEHDK